LDAHFLWAVVLPGELSVSPLCDRRVLFRHPPFKLATLPLVAYPHLIA
jgi:hypothetical protein